MKRALISVLAAVSLLSQGGCALVLIGGGALAGYSLSKDSIEGYTDSSGDYIWNNSIAVMRQRGALTKTDRTHGKFEGVVNGVTVKGEITPISDKTVKLRISGRKGLLPSVEVPQELFIKITENVSRAKQ